MSHAAAWRAQVRGKTGANAGLSVAPKGVVLPLFAAILVLSAPASPVRDLAPAARVAAARPACDGDGRWEVRGRAGIVLEEGECRAGERAGEWIFRFEDGSIASRGAYLHGLEEGRWIERSESGETEEGDYHLGERVGTWNVRSADGASIDVEYASDEPVRLSTR